jgi:RNA polymerase sigma-70 factor (ECF subfamily)
MAEPDDHVLKVQQLFVRHHGQLSAFVMTLWPDFSRADDVMQEVFLTVTAKAREFSLGTSFLAWGRAIVRFKVIEMRRSAGLRSPSPEMLDSLTAACPDEWAGDDQLAALTKCLGQLAPKAREIVSLRYQREHSPPEIAALLSRSVNSINVALSKARAALRECMDHYRRAGGVA